MHINVSGEQHTHSIKQLLKNISSNPESVKELSRWGLEIGSQILMVRLCFHFQIQLLMLVQIMQLIVFSKQNRDAKCLEPLFNIKNAIFA